MAKQVLCIIAGVLIATATTGTLVRPMAVAQESGKPATKSGSADEAKKVRSGDRLPANYGKIGVSEEQRKKIYEIQNKFEAQIESLEKQIAELKAKQVAEVESILTAEQKKALQSAIEESKKKAAVKKKSAAEKLKKSEEK